MTPPLVELKTITKLRGSVRILDQLSLSIEPGSVYGLLGGPQVGKTTAIRVCLGLIQPDQGEVRLFGRSPQNLTEQQKACIAYAAAGHTLPLHMTVSEACKIFQEASPSWDDELCGSILRDGQVPLHRRIRALSRGTKQYVRLALVYGRRPRFLALDEPLREFDEVTRVHLLSRIQDLVASGESSCLIASASPVDVVEIANRIGFLDKGRLVLDGSPGELVETTRKVVIKTEDEHNGMGSIVEEISFSPAVLALRQGFREVRFILRGYQTGWIEDLRRRFPTCQIETEMLTIDALFAEICRR